MSSVASLGMSASESFLGGHTQGPPRALSEINWAMSAACTKQAHKQGKQERIFGSLHKSGVGTGSRIRRNLRHAQKPVLV